MENTETKTTIKDRLRAGGYEAACAELKKEPLTLEQFKALYKDESEAAYYFAHHRITTATEALKEGHKFDWNNNDYYKHYPWWDMETYDDAPAGSGFSLHAVRYVRTYSHVGARLSSKSEEDVRFLTELMKAEYKIIMKN